MSQAPSSQQQTKTEPVPESVELQDDNTWDPLITQSNDHKNKRDAASGRLAQGQCAETFRMKTSLDDARSLLFWKAVFAEFLGTFILVLTGIGSTVQGWSSGSFDIVQVAISFGLSVAISVWIIGHISGGHINPAVTVAMLVTRRISLIRAIMFIIVQCLGAIVGAGLLYAVTPKEQRGTLGVTNLNVGVTTAMGFGVEACITAFLVLTVFATCDSKRTDHGGSYPLMIGFSVTIGHLWAVEYCGASMNPARSLGPAVVMDVWENHWVYWIAPMVGGAIAGLLYDNLLASNASLNKARDFMMSSKFDDEKYRAKKPVIRVVEYEEVEERETNI